MCIRDRHCPALKESEYKSRVKAAVYRNKGLIKNTSGRIVEDKELMNGIYSDLSVYRSFAEYLCSLLQTEQELPLNALKQQMPEGICNSNILLQDVYKRQVVGSLHRNFAISFREQPSFKECFM